VIARRAVGDVAFVEIARMLQLDPGQVALDASFDEVGRR
jgi:hypothetical protein